MGLEALAHCRHHARRTRSCSVWRSRYRCRTVDIAESPNEVHTVYAECEQNATVEHYQLLAGTHEWPATLGKQPTYEVIWAFLSRYALTQTASST